MSFVPILNESLGKITDTGFLFKHETSQIYVNTPDIEGSHIHEFYEIYINISGDVSFLHNKSIYRIKPGDIIFSNPGEFHYCIYHSDQIHEHCCIWFEATETSDLAKYIKNRNLSGHIRPDTKNIFDTVKAIGEAHTSIDRTTAFLNLLTQLYSECPKDIPEVPVKLRKILDYIDTNFAEIHFIEDVTSKFHISISTLNRWFRMYINLQPTALIRAKKLAYAKTLLKSDYSVTDACFMAGFSDCSRFIDTFRKTYGVTPFRYKKSLRENH